MLTENTQIEVLVGSVYRQAVGQGRTSSPGKAGIRGVACNIESASYRFQGVVVGSNPTLTAKLLIINGLS